MLDETVLPVIRTRKRRLVAPNKRKKAFFSCDRCKVRKIACHRADPSVSCSGCSKAGVDCATTIKRKRRIRGPIENIGLHYKCLHVLMANLFPDVDVNNIDALINMGELRGFQMPSRYGDNSKDEGKELRELSIVITSGKPLSRTSNMQKYPNQLLKEEEQECDLGISDTEKIKLDSINKPMVDQQPVVSHKDYIVMDLGGNTHCIGPLGAPGLLDSYMKIVGLYADVDLLKWRTVEKLARSELIIASNHEPIHQHDLNLLDSAMFPYFGEMNIVAAKRYVDIFFESVHPQCLCFNERLFRESHSRFWGDINTGNCDKLLPNQSICCIYMVWILGRLYDPTDSSVVVDESIIQRYVRIVKLCLSDILVTPSLDGIRCLLLLSIYMDNRMRRETGYILVELAARQCLTLGFSRRSLCLCTEDEDRREEIKRTWWSVFMHEVTFSAHMGRSSCIQIEHVTADIPVCPELDLVVPLAFGASVQLTKILCDVLQYRKHLSRSNSILASCNVARALEIHQQLTSAFESLDTTTRDLSSFHICKLMLHFRYHYYRLVISLPIFMYVVTTPGVVVTETMMFLINECVHLSIAIADYMEMSARHGVLNGTLFPEIFYAYHAVMALVVACMLVQENQETYQFEMTSSDIESAVRKIKKLQLSLSRLVGGTLHKISRYIDAFIGGLDYLKGRQVTMHADEEESVEKDYPIVGGPNVPIFFPRLKCEQSVLSPPPDNDDIEEFHLFLGRLGFCERGIGALDFSEIFLGDFLPSLDMGISDNLFPIDGF